MALFFPSFTPTQWWDDVSQTFAHQGLQMLQMYNGNLIEDSSALWQSKPRMRTCVPCWDMWTEPTHYSVTMDLPGCKKEDVTVAFSDDDHVLTISGERTRTHTRIRQSSSDAFMHTIQLPKDVVHQAALQATLADGVLTVVVPRCCPQEHASSASSVPPPVLVRTVPIQ
jgi:HSP20 family molecular chaperone IbpA